MSKMRILVNKENDSKKVKKRKEKKPVLKLQEMDVRSLILWKLIPFLQVDHLKGVKNEMKIGERIIEPKYQMLSLIVMI